MTVEGLPLLQRKLDNLGRSASSRVMRKSLGAGLTVVVKAARSRAPRRTGTTRKAIGKKVKVYSRGGFVGLVGVQKTPKSVTLHEPSRISHILERGATHMRGRRFMQTAWQVTRSSFTQAMLRAADVEMQKVAAE